MILTYIRTFVKEERTQEEHANAEDTGPASGKEVCVGFFFGSWNLCLPQISALEKILYNQRMEIQARKEAKRQERINSKRMKRVQFDGDGGIKIMHSTLDVDDSDDDDDDDPPESELSGSNFSDTEEKRIGDAR